MYVYNHKSRYASPCVYPIDPTLWARIELLHNQIIGRLHIVEVHMVTRPRDDEHLAVGITGITQVLDRLVSTLGVHPIVVAICTFVVSVIIQC
jgi:hypothetical protein